MNEQQLSVSSGQLAVIGDRSAVEEDLTPTQKIWQPVSDADKALMEAFHDFYCAMSHGDLDRATSARARIECIEAEQRQAHIEARAYLLQKVQQHG